MATPHGILKETTKEALLAQVDELLRTMPGRDEMRWEQASLVWLGQLKAVIAEWSLPATVELSSYLRDARDVIASEAEAAYNGILILLHQAHRDLTMKLNDTAGVVVPHKATYNYFEAVRKIVQMAKRDVLFVDPYMEADFVAAYVPHVAPGVKIRLLGRHKLPMLLSAVDAFVKEHGADIAVRSSDDLHGRYVFIDGQAGYQSSESFKDGARNAPSTITEQVETLAATMQIYEGIWIAAKVQR